MIFKQFLTKYYHFIVQSAIIASKRIKKRDFYAPSVFNISEIILKQSRCQIADAKRTFITQKFEFIVFAMQCAKQDHEGS